MSDLLLIIDRLFGRYARVVRYLLSGGTSFATNIVLLYIFKEYLQIGYLLASVIAFVFAFIVSFLMMKYVTFQDRSSKQDHKQLVAYFGVAIFNLAFNSLLLLLFVEKFNFWYIYAQILSSLLIAVSSFFIYKHLIFKKPTASL